MTTSRAQLRITDADGHRATAFVTNTTRDLLADMISNLVALPALA